MNTPDTNTVEGKIAVMTEYTASKKIECRYRKHSVVEWLPTCGPSWDWHNYDYRIAPSPVAPGHNPDKLTEEQVEVKFGWRLLAAEEIGDRHVTFDIQLYSSSWSSWRLYATSGSEKKYTYRTLRPPGFFLPKPAPAPKLRPISAKDWEKYPTIWVRDRRKLHHHELVYLVRPEDFGYGYFGTVEAFKTADYLEWSPDRLNWHSFMTNDDQ